MCRTRIIEVEKCATCPYLRWTWETDTCVKKENKKIKDIKTIPKWCPLKFYPYYYGNSGMKDEYGDY